MCSTHVGICRRVGAPLVAETQQLGCSKGDGSWRGPVIAALALMLLLPMSSCGEVKESSPPPSTEDSVSSTLSACPWDPGFGNEGCYSNNWWVEISVTDATTSALQVEVSGTPTSRVISLTNRYVLSGGHVKFAGSPGSQPIATGTPVRVLATQSAAGGGKTAHSAWFGYLQGAPTVECAACAPTCAPSTCDSDGCGGTCVCSSGAICMADHTCCHPNSNTCGSDGCGGTHGNCPAGQSCDAGTCSGTPTPTPTPCAWDPGFGTEGCTSNNWWVEFSVTDATTSALQVEVSGTPSSHVISLPGRLVLSGGYVKFTGSPGSQPIATGTPVRVLATQSAAGGGKTALSTWFDYLQGTPAADCAPCTRTCAPETCRSDGCGGMCACTSGAICMADFTCCHPNTNTCGSDGCGGTHGDCPAGLFCEAGVCSNTCTVTTVGDVSCTTSAGTIVQCPADPGCCQGRGCRATCGRPPALVQCRSASNCACGTVCCLRRNGSLGGFTQKCTLPANCVGTIIQ